jgi:hypothetical protein
MPGEDDALEWTRTTTPFGTGPQPAAYTIPPRGQGLMDCICYITPALSICQQVYARFPSWMQLFFG